jgi:hypothetical protein
MGAGVGAAAVLLPRLLAKDTPENILLKSDEANINFLFVNTLQCKTPLK